MVYGRRLELEIAYVDPISLARLAKLTASDVQYLPKTRQMRRCCKR